MKVHPALKPWGPEWDHPEVRGALFDLLRCWSRNFVPPLSRCGGRLIRWYHPAEVRRLAGEQGFIRCSYCAKPIRQGERFISLYAEVGMAAWYLGSLARVVHPPCAPLADTLTEQWG